MHGFDLSLEINLGMSIKCKIHISHQRMLQKLDKSGIKVCLSSYFSLPAKFQHIQSGIFAPIRAHRGGSTYRLCEQRRFRRACASAQSRQNLRCSLIQAVSQEKLSDRKPDPWSLWMAGHAQLKFVMTECSKTQIRLTGFILYFHIYIELFNDIFARYYIKTIFLSLHFVQFSFTKNTCFILNIILLSFQNHQKQIYTVLTRRKLKVYKIILSYNDRHKMDSLPQIA